MPEVRQLSLHRRRRGILILLRSTYPFTNAGHPRRSRATMLMLDGLLPKCGSRRNTISLPASLRASYPLEARITLNFANSTGHIRPQTCELPFRTFILAQVGPKRARRRDSRKVLPALYIYIFLGQQTVSLRTRPGCRKQVFFLTLTKTGCPSRLPEPTKICKQPAKVGK
ncbi:MAG: hypothetical protein A4E65_03576 [Syntrophorhabdus sp. PtaU1.Bin153]|nr:MAG: hypothetical protein A4E65_03576 [Syntrophorhabdus sp. PtaU1.Bin153]